MAWKLGDANKSLSYILPMLGGKRYHYQATTGPQKNFINCFVGDATTHYTDKIFLLYKFSGSLEYTKFEDDLQKRSNFFGMYDPDKEHVMYVFDVPEKFQEDYQKFKKGEYSKFSDQYKKQIISFLDLTSNESPIVGVLYKLESGYNYTEQLINKNLHRTSPFYIRIPRDLEASSIPCLDPNTDGMTEVYSEKLKVVSDPQVELLEQP